MTRSEWFWVFTLGVLVAAGYGLVPESRSDQEGSDSLSVSAEGKKAFFDLTRLLLPQVQRSSEHLVPPEDADTLVLPGPAQYPDRVEWQILHDWVAEGHQLLFAARYADPIVDMGPFDTRIVSRFRPELPAEEETTESTLPVGDLETSLASGELDWRSQGVVMAPLDQTEVLLAVDGSAHVIRRSIGDGRLIVASSDFIFSNLPLSRADNAVLAFRILEAVQPQGPVYFDETLNAAGPPKVVGLLFGEPLRPLTLQLIFCAMLFAWMTSRRRGPPLNRRESRRRSLTEHATALGNLHFRVGSGSRVVASYVDYFRSELGLHHRKVKASATLAEAEGIEKESMARLLDQAARAARNPNLPRAKAAWLVRSLAVLKRKIESLKGASHGA